MGYNSKIKPSVAAGHPQGQAPVAACQTYAWGAYETCTGVNNPTLHGYATKPNWEGLEVALAAQANSFAFGALVLGGLGLIGGIGWAIFVRNSAKREARDAAWEWMEKYGPSQAASNIAEAKEMLSPANTTISSEEVAERLGEATERSPGTG